MEDEKEASPGEIEVEKEGDRSKGVITTDLESAMKEDDLVADESETDIDVGEALEIDSRFNGDMNRECLRAVVVNDFSEKRFAVDDRKPHEEKEAVDLGLMTSQVEDGSRKAVWINSQKTGPGLGEKSEPEALLTRWACRFGSKIGHASRRLGLPKRTLGLGIKHLGPPPWQINSMNLLVESPSDLSGNCLVLEYNIIGPNFFQSRFGPKWKVKALAQMMEVLNRRLLLQFSICQNHQGSFEPPPTARPPPQPPDNPSTISRLELNYAVSAVLVYLLPTSLRVSGKADAAGDDPSDIQWVHRCPLTLDFKHRFEGKAVFKGLARAWILTREGSHVKEWSFTLPQLEQSADPIYGSLPYNFVFTGVTKSAHFWLGGREDVASIDPGNIPQLFSSQVLKEIEQKEYEVTEIGAVRQNREDVDNDALHKLISVTIGIKAYSVVEMPLYVESDLKGEGSKPTEERLTIGQLVWGIVICLFKWDDRQPREENAADNQMLETFYHSLRPPEFVDKGGGPLKVRREFDWALRLKREGSLVEEFIILLPVLVEPPSHPLYDLVSVLLVLVVTRDRRKLSGRVDAGGDDPGDDPTFKVQSRLFPGAIGKAYFGSYGAYVCIFQPGTNHHRRPSRQFTELIQEDAKPILKLTQSVDKLLA